MRHRLASGLGTRADIAEFPVASIIRPGRANAVHSCRSKAFAMNKDRAALYRRYALEAESKAFVARTSEPTQRAWLILARQWTKMAEKVEAEAAITQRDMQDA